VKTAKEIKAALASKDDFSESLEIIKINGLIVIKYTFSGFCDNLVL